MGSKLKSSVYEAELERLQRELVEMQEAIRHEGMRVAIIFEGRDTAGKGGTITRITAELNPRAYDVVALAVPTEREAGQWYFQRYVERLPARGELALFDRSWYNRAGVERVMGYCTPQETEEFLRTVPDLERMLVGSGLILLKYWLEVSPEQQERRFRERLEDPVKRWKLSPVDAEARARYEEYSAARDEMLLRTDIPEAPWFVVDADDQRRARLNCMQHILERVPQRRAAAPMELPPLERAQRASDPPASVARVPERW
ncbi:polyphosphate kinase 2 [Miltoncostaea marina]|uniref:polyphosphate kinase 2 n=1 Tax=Miltoncostaea marina TaxID=2843215 RepID=UPI001C3C9423|nr:polyphosphate kinase 2 [Miltoncostaea marina]